MNSPTSSPAELRTSRWIYVIAGGAFLLQFLTAARYGYFRDELYYIDCARHLSWGYVDQPPLIGLLMWLELHIGGSSLYSLRFLPAVAAGATAWLAARLSRVLGGEGVAQVLAALSVVIAPGFLMMFHLITMNAFEPLLWTIAAYLIVRIIQIGNQRLWLWFGIVCGIGILNKYSMLFFGAGVAVGLVLTRERRAFFSRWIWLGFAIAMLIWLPNVIWNIHNHWPFLELMRNVRSSGRDVTRSFFPFVLDQIFFMHFLTAPVWLAGVWSYFFGKEEQGEGGRYRTLGWTFVFLLCFYVFGKGKSYYLWPIYPTLFAAGGVAIDHWTSQRARILRPIYITAMILGGVLLAPLAVPLLSPERFIRYQDALHLTPPEIEHQRNGPLRNQIFADMFGWDEIAAGTARAYYSLPPDLRAKTGIAAGGYGDAGAINFFGPKYGLPTAVSGHQTYWFWGPHGYTGESLLLLGDNARRAHELCVNFDVIGHVTHTYSREDEHYDIFWCHPLRWNLAEIWPKVKHFN